MSRAVRSSTFGESASRFYRTIVPPRNLPRDVRVINPQKSAEIMEYTERFFTKYFHDRKNRVFVFGINPGRFGSGMTGIPFTDPVALEESCGIANTLEKRRELSSRFVYEFIGRWGGVRSFYKNFFLTAVSPIGFVRDGMNHNYYDDPKLLSAAKPFIVNSIRKQLAFGARRGVAIVLGTGKNQRIFNELNVEGGFFKKVYALEHPRYVIQYKRKRIGKYLAKYREIFSEALAVK